MTPRAVRKRLKGGSMQTIREAAKSFLSNKRIAVTCRS